METWYIAMDETFWGRGRSVDDARRELRKAGGKLRTHLVYRFDIKPGEAAPYIDDAGNSVTSSECDRVLVAATRKGVAIPNDALAVLA